MMKISLTCTYLGSTGNTALNGIVFMSNVKLPKESRQVQVERTRESLLKGKISTVDLFVTKKFSLFNKTSYLNDDVNCTEPSLVRVSCINLTIKRMALLIERRNT